MTRLLLLAALALADCDKPRQETSISFNTGDAAGSVDAKSGEVKLDVPGLQGAIKLPKVKVNADNFDMNGVRLYPGSTIDKIDVTDTGRAHGLFVTFRSPAPPTQVRDWLQRRLVRAGFTLSAYPQGLAGTTNDNKPFALMLMPDGDAHARGTIAFGT